MSYSGLGDTKASGPAPSVAYGRERLPSSGMATEASIRPNTFVTQDLPWGIGKERERAAAEDRRQRSTHRLIGDHGHDWVLIGSTSTAMDTLLRVLRRLGLLATDDTAIRPEGAHNRKVYEHFGVGLAAKRAWQRLGRAHAWNIRNLTDNNEAGWTWDHGRFLRLHSDLWDKIRTASVSGPAWQPSGDQRGFVYVIGGTYRNRDLLIDRIAKRLQLARYLSGGPIDNVVFTSDGNWRGGDDGPFITALKKVWTQEMGRPGGRWPEGYNFGPTEGKNLRVHPDLLRYLNENMLLGERRKMNQQLLVKVIGPVRGGFPKVQ